MCNKSWEDKLKYRIKEGDDGALKLLYEKFYPGLCILSSRYTQQPEIAEEIVQDTFMKLWEGRKNINIRGSLHSYLFSAVRNSSLNYLKHLIVERKFSLRKVKQLQSAINNLQISQEDGASILIAEEIEKSLDDAISDLPPKCREIFLLNRKQGLKHSEISEKLGISQNTVQRQMSIAIEKLSIRLLPGKTSIK